MFGSPVTSSLSLGKIVGGISKSLGIINQLIPIYKETKPVIGNLKSAFSLIKEFKVAPSKPINTANKSANLISTEEITSNNNNPVFFV